MIGGAVGMAASSGAGAVNNSGKAGIAHFSAPIVIAHRGASGYVPEHTLAAYALAILQGADFIEPDLVMTRDGHLVARHDNVLDLTTDVSQRPEFADRRTTKMVEGVAVTDWFSEDFTLAEIKQLRAVERIPLVRPANTRLDRQFEIPTLQEIIDLVQAMERSQGRRIGIYPETKLPTHFASLGLPMEETLVKILHANGYSGRDAPVFIQSFEVGNLQKLREMTKLPLIQLLWLSGQPYDQQAARTELSYDRMATAAGLADVARYADGVGPEKCHFIIPLDDQNRLDRANVTSFVPDAHAVGLQVHPYTFRAENTFLPSNLQRGDDARGLGDGDEEIRVFLSTGIDGFFADQADIGVRARNAFKGR